MKKEGIKWNLDDIIKEKGFDSFNKKTIRELKNLSRAIYSLTPNMKVKDFKIFIKQYEKVIALSTRVTDFSSIHFTTHLVHAHKNRNKECHKGVFREKTCR